MPLTVRLPPELQEAAAAAAERIGVSLNALLCVALADWLKVRTIVRSAPASTAAPATTPSPALSERLYRAPKRRTDACPCGAHLDGRPVKWKHCHGKPPL